MNVLKKNILFPLLLMLLTPCISYGQTYEKTLGALWYYKMCQKIPNRLIPLYTNSPQTRELTLKEYSTAQYYGSTLKSTEYPNEEWVATYSNGFLYSVYKKGGDKIYKFYYSQNVLYKMVVYSQSTGSQIDTYSKYDTYRNGDFGWHNYGTVHYVFKGTHYDFNVSSGISWKIYATYSSANDGVRSSYVAIGRKNNAWGVKEGDIYKSSGWLIQNSYGAGWRRMEPQRLLNRLYSDIKYDELNKWDFEVNNAGLPVRNGMPNTCAEALQQVVYKYSNGQYIYEYTWSY